MTNPSTVKINWHECFHEGLFDAKKKITNLLGDDEGEAFGLYFNNLKEIVKYHTVYGWLYIEAPVGPADDCAIMQGYLAGRGPVFITIGA